VRLGRILLLTAFVVLSVSTAGAVSLVSNPVNGANYFELELNGVTYEIESEDTVFRVDLDSFATGYYVAALYAVNENGRCAPIHFSVYKEQTHKNFIYYVVTPEGGYEEKFIEPTSMTVNVNAGKPIGK
jgi:hypothetical protein